MSSVDAARQKNLRIKTGVLKRTAREKEYYIKEAEKEKEKLEKMKEDSTKDEHDVKKQHEIMSESLMMISDCERKLKVAFDDLTTVIEKDSDLNETEEHKGAVAMLDETRDKVAQS